MYIIDFSAFGSGEVVSKTESLKFLFEMLLEQDLLNVPDISYSVRFNSIGT